VTGSRVMIAPSLLAADFTRLGEAVRMAEEGGASYLHIDVMDGHFVPNISMGVPVTRSISRVTSLPLDVHLMIESPERYIGAFAEAGADVITVHAEACGHLHRTVQAIKELEVGAGVAINPATPISALEYLWSDVDLLLVMSVNPGFGGQGFIASALDKIRRAASLREERHLEFLIEVDGGINLATVGPCAKAGADLLVAGSAIYGTEDPVTAIRGLLAEGGGLAK